ncbi:MAG: DUF882 domain-containing protein [Pseudomonadota bacterium]
MMSRRTFLQYAAVAGATLAAPAAMAKAVVQSGERRLSLYNIHTGERLTTPYWADGVYLEDELTAINRLLRDHRSGEVSSIDYKLLDRLHSLQQQLGHNGSFQVISGYRSAASNAKLQRASNGVAKRSLHMQGRAIDIRLPGVELKHLRQVALSQRAGGVGYYQKSNFIHLDTGRTRFW